MSRSTVSRSGGVRRGHEERNAVALKRDAEMEYAINLISHN